MLYAQYMGSAQKPTIKGIFVNSHIKAVRDLKGDAGVAELEKKYGKPIAFKNSEDVPVREEVKIIEAALDIVSEKPIPPEERTFEAGRLHFRNFTGTPFGKIIFALYKNSFKLIMLRTQYVAGHVFSGVKFTSYDLGEKQVKIVMENNDYPVDHFRGLFQQWMEFAGLTGKVEAHETASHQYEYLMTWQ